MCKIIGITGGIGSGKSTVASIFRENGFKTFIADDISKNILDKKQTIDEVISIFGVEILDTNGLINKKKLSNIVFTNNKMLEYLNSIMHIKVNIEFDRWINENEKEPFIIIESAILFESEFNKKCDYVINVIAPLDIRIERVLLRDNIDKESILDRIKNQLNDDIKNEMSDYVINNININETINMVKHIINLLKF